MAKLKSEIGAARRCGRGEAAAPPAAWPEDVQSKARTPGAHCARGLQGWAGVGAEVGGWAALNSPCEKCIYLESILIWEWGLCGCHQVKTRQVEAGPSPMTGAFIRGTLGTVTQWEEEGGPYWSDTQGHTPASSWRRQGWSLVP
jgi:hypothetical protein